MNDRKKQSVAPDHDQTSEKQDRDLIQLIAMLVARRHLSRIKNQKLNEEGKHDEDKEI